MDRLEFLQSIKRNNMELADIVVHFFDQYMLLYNLIDTVNDISIVNSSNSAISFQLDYSDTDSVQKLNEKLKLSPYISIYESNYAVSYVVMSPVSIIITISK
jgi:cell fate (sporulation/competence/biofilm development) regulator YlbF (YheA/YmcA/DUF963 family)